MPTVAVTQADLDAYHAAVMANPRGRLAARRQAAMDRLRAADDFIAHRYATAYHSLMIERCDTAFAVDCWGYADRASVRAALFSHLRMIRRQIARAKRQRLAA